MNILILEFPVRAALHSRSIEPSAKAHMTYVKITFGFRATGEREGGQKQSSFDHIKKTKEKYAKKERHGGGRRLKSLTLMLNRNKNKKKRLVHVFQS